MSRAPVGRRDVDRVAKQARDEEDLDVLMRRVREAAMAGTTSAVTVQPQVAGEAAARELDLVKVLEAQGEWNEQARQSLAALVDCIRTLRDDWADAQAGLRRELERLSALVGEVRSTTAPAASRSLPADAKARTRRAVASPRTASKRRPAEGRRPRS